MIILLVLFLPLLLLSNPRIAATDEAQYYVYLTSLRFDGDLNFANDYRRLAELNPRAGIENLLSESRIRPSTGLYGNIAPVGSAILWTPFFLLADLFVRIANLFGAGIPADGFSRPYMLAVCYGSAIYGFLGLPSIDAHVVWSDGVLKENSRRELAARAHTVILGELEALRERGTQRAGACDTVVPCP